MNTKMLAWLGSLFLGGCAELWGPLTADNHDNCVVTPGICSAAETCSPVLERCVPLDDGGIATCPAVPCPSGQGCDVTAGRCVSSSGSLDLLRVRPRTGPLTGLPMVTVEGLAFTSPADVRFGDKLSAMNTVLSGDRIAAQVPPAAVPGLVRVEVSLSSGMRVTKERMFSYAFSQIGFGIEPTLDTQMQSAGPVIITDLSNDQQPDVAVAHNTRVSTYFGGPNGPVFRDSNSGASTLTALNGRFVAGRIDGDSRNDLVLSDPAQGNVLTLINEGSGEFDSPTVTSVGAGLRDIALADA